MSAANTPDAFAAGQDVMRFQKRRRIPEEAARRAPGDPQ
jgi:hypothetical protein